MASDNDSIERGSIMLSESEHEAAVLAWLLDVEFKGIVYRFSQFTIDIQKADGSSLQYVGGLSNIDYEESTDLTGVNVEGNSVSLALVFQDVDFVQEWRRGFVLDGSSCELSYVLIKDGIVQQEYENRERVFVGEASEAVFGDPLEPIGFVAFSIENRPYTFAGPMIPKDHVISEQTFPNAWEESIGKVYPTVVGSPGSQYTNSSGGSTLYTYSTPAYLVKFQLGETSFDYVMIAGHPVDATHIRIRDSRYNAAVLPVLEGVDSNGVLYSYVDIEGTSLIQAHTLSNDVREYWCTWNFNMIPFSGSGKSGGGLVNSEGGGFIHGAGDLIIWALRKSGAVIDYQAWESVRGLLNEYKFSGYINEPVTAWNWLQNNILPFLPIEARAGINGIKPLVNLLFVAAGYVPSRQISTSSDFKVVSPITMSSSLEDIVNRYEIRWCKSGYVQTLTEIHIVEAEREYSSAAISSSNYAWTSRNRYGLHEKTEDSDYIYDRNTAARVAQEKVRAAAFPFRTFTVLANIKFGYLQLGDVIRLTSNELYLNDDPVIVVAKSWTGSSWRFIINIEDNPILIDRAV